MVLDDKKSAAPSDIKYIVAAKIIRDEELIQTLLNEKSCYIFGTNMDKNVLTAIDIIQSCKWQHASIENIVFRFLKDRVFFLISYF